MPAMLEAVQEDLRRTTSPDRLGVVGKSRTVPKTVRSSGGERGVRARAGCVVTGYYRDTTADSDESPLPHILASRTGKGIAPLRPMSSPPG